MKTYASLVLFALLAGCGGGTQTLANAPEFDLPARSLGNPAQPDTFGQAVGFVGGGHVAVGAPSESGGASHAGQVHVFDAATGAVETTLTSPQPRRDGSFGAAIAVKDGDLLVGAPGEGRVHRFDAATGELEATIVGPPDEDFGAALAVVGDLVAIGAPRRAVGQGAVYLHDCETGARVGRILSATPSFSGAFGSALAAFGGDLLVGAPAEGEGRGAVHLVRLPDGRALLRIESPAGLLGGAFGEAVAAAAGDILVGAPGEERAYMFASNGALRHVLDNPGEGGLFGIAVHYADGHLLVAAVEDEGAAVYLFSAISGAFERRVAAGDGAPGGVAITAQGGLALIGVPAGSGALRGLATTMNCDTGQFEQVFESPDPTADATFGDAVCILDDGRVVVGEPDADSGDGAVHVFEPDGELVTTFNPPTSGLAANFGRSLAPLGNRVIIGAPGAEPNEQGAVFVGNPATGQLDVTISSPDPVAGGRFGEAVANVDGRILVGEPFGFDNSGEGQSGAAYSFDDQGTLVHTLHEPTPSGNSEFGFSVAASGSDYLVGAPVDDAAYCFDGTDGSFKRDFLPDGLAGTVDPIEDFGVSVAGDDIRIFVGADEADVFDPDTETTFTDAGRVYVFDKATGASVGILESPDAIDFGLFGHRLSLSGNRIAVAAPVEAGDDVPIPQGQTPREGRVHLFEVSSLFRLGGGGSDDPNPNQDTEFAYSVFLKDNVLAVGSPFELVEGAPAGRAYRIDLDFLGFMFSPNPTEDAGFGFSIAGFDEDVAVVGEPLTMNGNGAVYLIDTRTNQLVEQMNPSGTLQGAGLGLSVTVLGNGLIAAGAPGDALGAGTVRIFNGAGTELAVITNPGAGGAFGFSVAAVGADRLAIGAPGSGSAETGPPGIAYLFEVILPGVTGAGATVNQLEEYENPLGQNDDEFGYDVAAFGNDVLVCAPGANSDEGRAFRFAALTGGTPAATFQAPTPLQGERFGQAANELPNPAGASEVAIGAPATGFNCTVYIFGAAGAFARQLTDPEGNPGSGFGFDIKGLPDRTLIVGAPAGTGSATGIAYVVDGLTGAMLEDLSSANGVPAGLFGASVGCLTNGHPLVGAPLENVNPDRAGRAYRFGRLQGDGEPPPPPDDTVTFEAPNPTAGDGFGTQVAFSGTRVLVSAPCANGGSGEVYVYEGATGALLDTIMNPAGSSPDKFGCSLAANALMIAVGASEADQGATRSGAAYLFSAETRALLLTFDLDDPQIDGGHGKASGVGSANIVVGEPFADVMTTLSGLGQPDAGRAYIYDCRVATIIQALLSPNPQVLGLFGCCVHIDGSNVYVAACGENGAEGRVYCFDLVSGQLLRTILPPTAQSGQFFGTACRTINGNVIVGAPGFDEDQLAGTESGDQGIVYVINPATGAALKTLRSGNPVPGGLFGTSVATNGTTIIVGAPGEAGGDGRVYVFNAQTCALLATLAPPAGVTGGSMGVSVAAMADNVLAGAPTANNAAGAAFLNPPEAGGGSVPP